jgi:hypothetical protein
VGGKSALGHKRTLRLVRAMSALPESGHGWQSPRCSLILGCSGWISTSNKIIKKGLAFSTRQSGSVPGSRRSVRFRDPAPPACSLRWGFGGGGDGRCTTEGDPDDQGQVEAQARITPK